MTRPVYATLRPDGICYPCLISLARYGGTYEGGRWVAYPFDSIPEDAEGEDNPCRDWFEENSWSVGIGPTPNDAAAHLIEQLEAAERAGRANLTRLIDRGGAWIAESQVEAYDRRMDK